MEALRKIQSVKDLRAIGTIGTGSCGKVVLATTPEGRPVAVKVIAKSHAIKTRQITQISREVALLKHLQHPGIVQLLQCFQDARCVYLVLEYVPGGELLSRVMAQRLSAGAAKVYAGEVLLALEYLHERKVIHRDIKPENILVDEAGHLKLTDFGFAREVEGRTFTFCGTPEYLAPEMLLRKGHSMPVDCWALGVLMYEVMVGQSPFFAESPYEVYRQILGGDVQFPQFLSQCAVDLITRLLHKDPSQRLTIREAKAHSYFSSVSWDKLRLGDTPWKPSLTSPADCGCFQWFGDGQLEDFGEEVGEEDQRLFQDIAVNT